VRIGIIGAGHIGGTLAKLFIDAGHEVAVSNWRGPETLAGLVEELGGRVQAATAAEAARFGEVVVVSVPFGSFRELPREGGAGKPVIDTNNYYPQRDGHFEELDSAGGRGFESRRSRKSPCKSAYCGKRSGAMQGPVASRRSWVGWSGPRQRRSSTATGRRRSRC
jgi:8-hydroxy-5-deazaflavin:NADPH oxidoreductase